MSNQYPGTFEFITSTDPIEAFDRVKAMSTVLGQEIKLVYVPPRETTIAINAQSTKEAFAAAINNKLGSASMEDTLFYSTNHHAYSRDLAGENLAYKHAQEIANKTGVAVDYLYDGTYTSGIEPERKTSSQTAQLPTKDKKPSAQKRLVL